MATQSITATFTGAQPLDGDVPYIDVTWPSAYPSASVYRISAGAIVTDGNGTMTVCLKSKTATGVRVFAADQFVGTVELLAFDV